MRCPACHYEQPDGRASCEACGVLFANYDPSLPPAVKSLRDQEAQETPENGWAVHHVGQYTWREGPTTITGRDGVKVIPAGRFEGTMPFVLFFFAFFGFFPVFFSWGRLLPYYLGGLALLTGVYLFALSFSKLRQKRAMEDTPLSTVRGMAPGQVELTGNAVGPAPFQAPFTGTDCVYYETQIEEYVQSGKDSTWMTVERKDSGDKPFLLDDGTGQVAVHPNGAETKFAHPYSVQVTRGKNVPGPVLAYLENQGLTSYLSKTLRFTERRLEPGKPVFVMGICQKQDGPEGEGEVFIGRGTRADDIFLFSDKPREKLEKGYAWQAFWFLFLGIALIGGAVYGLVRYFTK